MAVVALTQACLGCRGPLARVPCNGRGACRV